MRSSFAAILNGFALPFGRTSGRRIVFDGPNAQIRFYNAADELVGFLGTDRWFAGRETDGARVQLDPLGGLRIFDDSGRLVGVFDGQGVQIRDPATGLVHVNVGHHGTVFTAQDGKQIHIVPTQDGTLVIPKWAGAEAFSAGANVATPALVAFTPDDLELRFGFVASPFSLGGTFTPPAGYTEVIDTIQTTDGISLGATMARRQPHTVTAVRNFVCSQSGHPFHNGHTILIRANDSGTAPSVRSTSNAFFTSSAREIPLTLAKPSGAAAGDRLIAVVAMMNKGGFVPSSWSVPEGWEFAGAVFRDDGQTDTLASGVWYKDAGASEPSDYSVTVNVPDDNLKRFHATIVAVQDPGILEGGSDIRFEPQSSCRLVKTIDQNFAAIGTPLTVDWDAITYDPGNCFNGGTNRYRIPASGPYKFGFQMTTTGSDTAGADFFRMSVSLYQGGSFVAAISGTPDVASPGGRTHLVCHDRQYFVEGDELSIDAVQGGAVTPRGLEGGGSSQCYAYFGRDIST